VDFTLCPITFLILTNCNDPTSKVIANSLKTDLVCENFNYQLDSGAVLCWDDTKS